jgi:hypothetical protein
MAIHCRHVQQEYPIGPIGSCATCSHATGHVHRVVTPHTKSDCLWLLNLSRSALHYLIHGVLFTNAFARHCHVLLDDALLALQHARPIKEHW